MKQLSKNLIAIALAVVMSVTAGTAVLAQTAEEESPRTQVTTQQTPTQQTRQTREQRVQQVQRTLERCEQIKTRLADRISKSAEVKIAHTERYEKLVNRIDAVITSAEARQYDTAGLIAAKEAVTASIAAYGVALETYSQQLTSASELACDQSASVYGQAIVSSREALEAVRAAGAAVKTAFRQSVVPELQEYKTWLEANATATEESAE